MKKFLVVCIVALALLPGCAGGLTVRDVATMVTGINFLPSPDPCDSNARTMKARIEAGHTEYLQWYNDECGPIETPQ